MAITRSFIEDKIEVVGDFKALQIRTVTIIREDGVEIGRTYSRHVIFPGDLVTSQSIEVQNISGALHTDELKTAYLAHLQTSGV